MFLPLDYKRYATVSALEHLMWASESQVLSHSHSQFAQNEFPLILFEIKAIFLSIPYSYGIHLSFIFFIILLKTHKPGNGVMMLILSPLGSDLCAGALLCISVCFCFFVLLYASRNSSIYKCQLMFNTSSI